MSEATQAADEIVALAIVDVARNARAAERKAVVDWLTDTNFGDDELDTASLVFAGAIERGEHRA